MLDIIIGIVATIISTVILSLFGMIVIKPYRKHREIFKKILRVIRNYEDPRKYGEQILAQSITINCIGEQMAQIEELFDLMTEQKDLNPFLYKLFRYHKIQADFCILFEYIRNPIMLDKFKEFDDKYLLDTKKLFKSIRKNTKIPFVEFRIIAVILLLLFIIVLIIAFKLAISSDSFFVAEQISLKM